MKEFAMRGQVWRTVFLCGGLMTATATTAGEAPLTYPTTKRGDQVDDYHGVKVADPYRWLETDVRNSKEVADWVGTQAAVTEAYLKKIPERDAIKDRLTELWNYEKYSAP